MRVIEEDCHPAGKNEQCEVFVDGKARTSVLWIRGSGPV